jgi:G protein-coupled receptor Mth (Methuselah protein)
MWNGNYGRFMFSTVPLAILEICNVILFIKTVVHCLQVKREIDKMNDTRAKGEKQKKFNTFKDRFGLLLKLFIVMGISFLFEVVSTFYDFKGSESTAIIEQIWDIFNCLHGLFIFMIFLLKRKTLEKLKVITKFSNPTTDIVNLP